MNASQLRIGNWIKYKTLYSNSFMPKKVEASDILLISDPCEREYYSPIELSSDILLGAGFECTSKGFFTHPDWYNLSLKLKNGTYDLRVNFMERIATNINYLHQVQNLFYDFDHKELSINL